MSRIENPREAIKDGSTGIFCLSITCQYGLLTMQYFALDFLQIPPHGGHPCPQLMVPTTTAHSGLSPPS